MTLHNLIVSNDIELTHFLGSAQRECHALMPIPIHIGYKNLDTKELFIIEYKTIENELEPCIPTPN